MKQLKKNKTFISQKKDILHISSELVDHPLIIFNHQYEVLFINSTMQEYLHIQEEASVQELLSLPLLTVKGKVQNIANLLLTYDINTNKKSMIITDVTIQAKEKKKSVSLRISKSSNHIGFAIFDMTGKLAMLQNYYLHTSTGLPNQNKAIADIGLMVNKSLSNHTKFATCILSIDNYLEIITTIGYKESLKITLEISKYLQETSHKNLFQLYHMTGNSFLLILPNIQTNQGTISLVNQYKSDCEDLLHHNTSRLHFTISAGISIYPDNIADKLISRAYEALRQSKNKGLGHTSILAPDAENSIQLHQSILYREIKEALETEQFIIYYQPIYDAQHLFVRGAEALIRWEHPSKGIIPPEQFLPLVEDTGFMKHLSEFVIEKTIKQISIWDTLGFNKVQVAINLSLRDFATEDFPTFIASKLQKYKIEASQLKIEITENIAMSNESHTLSQLSKLRKLGIEISLDDFGTGYSSFSMLEALPINTLKIDKSFVTDLDQNNDHHNIVKAMIAMAHALHIKVIAEGVENKNIVTILQELNCDYLQGYYYTKPIPAFEFQELIRSDKQTSDKTDIITVL